ncbi:BQ2448_2198 [Microbotryum intermedium]|uniref:Actin-like protein ARP6 n=1 Tax=Microbotryum intermedium TaxID=269621 RepID=A0A238FDF9_9BASI|nr:BQ2448_2198 [Microbotryum intermedium]
MNEPALIIDNGAHTIKALWANSPTHPNASTPQVYRNAIIRSKTERRNYVADEFDDCHDFGALTMRLAFERGILNNWDVEKQVWDRVFSNKGRGLPIDPSATRFVITEPIHNLPNVREHYDQILFEELEVSACLRIPGPLLVPYGPTATRQDETTATEKGTPECLIVVDAGFSFTHVVPIYKGRLIEDAIRRIDAGGKLLTNHLKELVSLRQWYMMDQTMVMERAKEECCYVTNHWERDWNLANSNQAQEIIRTYVLPDFLPGSKNKLGFVRDPNAAAPSPSAFPIVSEMPSSSTVPTMSNGHTAPVVEEQLLQMNNERFTVPEILFNPTTIGELSETFKYDTLHSSHIVDDPVLPIAPDLNQQGLSECIATCINSLPIQLQGLFWSNIILVGGSTLFPGFQERLYTELRALAPQDSYVQVRLSKEPILETVRSGKDGVESGSLDGLISRKEYSEVGSAGLKKRFAKRFEGGRGVMEKELGL